MNTTIMIAGAAGEGINTLSSFLEKVLKRNGQEIYSYRNYMSRVRGGYNYTVISMAKQRIYATSEQADVLIAFNQEALANAQAHLKDGGLLLTSDLVANKSQAEDETGGKGSLPDNHCLISVQELKQRASFQPAHIMAYAGAVLRYLGIAQESGDLLSNKKWKEEIRRANRAAFDYGYELVPEGKFGLGQADGKTDQSSNQDKDDRLLLSGNQSIALGALAAGLGFYCAYPMAPSTSIMNYLAGVEKQASIIVEQAEDEIAAIIATIGASSNGVRSMTGTSGGGFSLMVEGLGFAAVAEVPVVVANVQRPGPATGLPTRTEQADFAFAAYASQGEFARIILAPTDVEDCFYTTFRAFDLADKYQCPVILLSDQLLADSNATVPAFDLKELTIERYLAEEEDHDYKRYDFQRIHGGRRYPGMREDTLIMTDSHTHDEQGYITEDPEMAIALKNKFLKREQEIAKELQKPELVLRQGANWQEVQSVLIGWGSTAGVLRDTVDQMDGVAALIFREVFPLPEDILAEYTHDGKRLIAVEANGTAQFAKYLKMLTGIAMDHHILKYDGRPFTVEYLTNALAQSKGGTV